MNNDGMATRYQPAEIENKWYKVWEAGGHFAPAGSGEPYAIMIPPPNVTGTLHMGHAFQDTIMDALIRYQRMNGRRTLWQPGSDHAGIATQMVVERQLNAQGKTRHDLGREAFTAKVWEWKAQSGGQIMQQLRRLGASLDWTRERFTMDDDLSRAVRTLFVRLHEDGLIYRGKRLVNWDPVLKTAISDLEVENREESGFMYHVRYPFVAGQGLDGEYMHIATTRPETILADGALAVHPDDERYRHLLGKMVHVPLTERVIPIIADEYVEMDFGTGCVKITPAHDFNDYAVGQRHTMEVINLMNPDATLNDNVPTAYRGLDRWVARDKIVADLKSAGLLEKIEPHTLKRPYGDRSGVVIEPYLTDQWFVDLSSDKGMARSTPCAMAASSSCRKIGKTPTTTGWKTCKTGASRANSGGGTASPPGMTRTATPTSPKTKQRRAPNTSCPPTCRSPRTKTCWIPGFPRRCGHLRHKAGRTTPPTCATSTPATSSSPALTSSSSGSRAWS